MAVDKGYLRYKIELDSDKAVEGLLDFRKQLIKSRNSFRRFRRDVSQLGTGAKQLKNTLRELAKVTVDGADAASKAAKSLNKTVTAQKKANKEHKKEVRSKKASTKATKELTVVEKERRKLQASLSAARARLLNKELRKLSTELAVVRKIAAGYQKLAVAKRLGSKGRDIQTGLKFERLAELKVVEAQNALEREQALLNNKELTMLHAQLAVQKKIASAEAAQTQQQILQQRGRLASGLTVPQEAARRFASDLQRLQVQGLVDQMKEAHPAFKKTTKGLENIDKGAKSLAKNVVPLRQRLSLLNDIFHKTRSGANRIFFTFRRLIGIFAAFLIIRKVIEGFNALIGGAVKYNAAIEQSILGIASLITATSDVRTATGGVAEAQEQLSLAVGESRRQIGLLRKDALTTVATFKQLVETYQTALGPGIAQGLDVDQIRQFTIQISQAAAAIGLAQNQLAEEIRSILMGTIQLRTTRIAAVLGITNADIKNAKEMGVLADFLNERFRAFTEAGKEALTLYNAIIARLGDAFNELLRQGSTEFFVELKALLTDILGTLVSISDTGVSVNPRALEAVRGIFDGLRRAVAEAQRLRGALSIDDMGAAAAALGKGLGTAAEVLGAMIEGVIAGFKDMATLLKPVITGLKSALPNMELQDFVRIATEAVVVVASLKALLGATVGVVFFLVGPIIKVVTLFSALIPLVSGIVTGIVSMGVAILGMSAPMWAVVGAAAALIAAFAVVGTEMVALFETLTGTELKLGTIIRIVKVTLVAAFAFAAAAIKSSFFTITNPIKMLLRTTVAVFRNGLIEAARLGLNIASLFGADVDKKLRELTERRDSANKTALEDALADISKQAAAYDELYTAITTGAVDAGREIGKALRENADAETFEQMVARLKAETKGLLSDIFGDLANSASGFNDSMGDATDTSIDLVATLKEMPGIISRGARGIEGLAAQVTRLERNLRRTAHGLETAFKTVGLDDGALETRRIIAEEEFKLKENSITLDARIKEAQETKATVLTRLIDLEKETLGLTYDQVRAVDEGVAHSVAMLEVVDRINAAESRRESLILLANLARKKGNAEQAAALDNEIRQQESALVDLNNALLQAETIAAAIAGLMNATGNEASVALIVERVRQLGLERAIEQEILDLLAEREVLEGLINKSTINRILAASKEREHASQQNLRVLEAELQAERALLQFASSLNIDTRGRELAAAKGLLGVEEARLANLRQTYNLQEAGNKKNTADLIDQGANAEELAELRRSQRLEEDEITTSISKQLVLVKKLKREEAEAQRKKDTPRTFGLETAAADFSREALDQFERFVDIGTEAIEGFASFVSSTIADAFDPNSDSSVKERFAQFLSALSNMIIEYLVNRAIGAVLASLIAEPDDPDGKDAAEAAVSAVLLAAAASELSSSAKELAGAAAPWFLVSFMIGKAARQLEAAATLLLLANAIGAAKGGATGGPVTGGGSASVHHARSSIQGFDQGGRVRNSSTPSFNRPSGLDPRDTEPVWARVGEWFIRPESVSKYGNQVMSAINRGLIDPMLLKGLAGARGAMRVSQPRKHGFATGGAVTGDASSSSGPDQGLQQTVLVASESAFEQLLAAGSSAQMRWLQDHADELRTIVS